MWAQGVLPEWMYPKDIGVMVSVKDWPKGQWLEVLECGGEITDEIINTLQDFKCPIKYSKGENSFIIGPSEFQEFFENYAQQNYK